MENKFLPTNCPNCGAVLENGFCKYCGTQVFEKNTIDMICDGYADITLNFKRGNETYSMPLTGYISEVNVKYEDCISCRDITGRIKRIYPQRKNVEFVFVGEIRSE